MTSNFRFMGYMLTRIRIGSRYYIPSMKTYKAPGKVIAIPCTIGFSLFTWLGLEKQLSAEDELINTIKHCVLFIQKTEYDKAEQLLHVALRQAQQINHQLGITYIYDVMANLALERQQLEKAKNLFVAVSQRLLTNGATENDTPVVHISIKLARISHLMKEYTTAQLGYDYCLQKLNDIYSKEPNAFINQLLAMTEDWYGRLFLDCGKEELALQFMINSLNKLREVSEVDQEHIVIQLNDIGTVCERMGKVDESISYFQEAIEIGKKLDMDEIGTMYVNLGRAFMKKSLIEEARRNCGYAWRLGVLKNSAEIKSEAEECLGEIKNFR